ncbi:MULTISPECIES: PilZ domain-containing protein [Bradyrhizobium]|uniref:Pilus assembly protein PilZ n=1 Tax=Bradyrhizobium canariense TaxID=255045 RepID=A0A1X3HB46_9BRAD|nr:MULTISPECIES: PilZ domain-containing protein [Bradyrhizobium]OSI71617.1 pilus assembly protein PilZ [Bradyrhizobium canariense]OSI80579.1 pilus assembly protein PilZ [Bradyrhizobium canariense]OSI91182.1 pilus assembly protein PilZ [Bradyrhizobium canariense]OSI96255.1 pilus assembly protein PilZ [Bradyrhizobium canariense]OSJ09235.1 pilus assembly protein PilZ [Bradyrhizobium canariense]
MRAPDKRGTRRVAFERAIPASMMAIDGTWQRACSLQDVSDSGAKLLIEGSVESLPLNEFFLVLSSTGLAYRRCELAWVNGGEVGVTFISQDFRGRTKAQPAGTR